MEETVIRLKERLDEDVAEQSKLEDIEKKISSVLEAEDLVSYFGTFFSSDYKLNAHFFACKQKEIEVSLNKMNRKTRKIKLTSFVSRL